MTTARTGMAVRIAAFVAAHPGCTRAELLAGCGIADIRNALPTYCTKVGMIHAAGPRGSQRYYRTAEQAAAAHDRIVALVAQRSSANKQAGWLRDNLRKRAARHAAGGKARNTRPGQHRVKLDPGVKLAPDVRITIAPPLKDRWAA